MLKFFEQFTEVTAVMSEKEDGTMRLRDDGENMENRNRFFEKAGIDSSRVIGAKLEQGVNVKIISDNKEKIISGTDALITKEKNIFLSISVADCLPVFFYEVEAKIIAIAHAGWRGIAGGVIENTIEKIIESGGEAKNLKVALGPGINQCHFEAGGEVAERFIPHLFQSRGVHAARTRDDEEFFQQSTPIKGAGFKNYQEYILKKDNKYFIDLRGIAKSKLNEQGVKLENIEDSNICTSCSPNLFSFRRDKPEIVEAMVAVIGFKSPPSKGGLGG